MKENNLSGTLTLVPTPIGNLGDITLRALEVLQQADVVLCEDTRTSGMLFSKLGIKVKLLPYHAHNEHKSIDRVVTMLEEGNNVCLVSDAGTPGISDPGFLVVRALIEKGIKVTCLPGPTALIPALVMSGLPSDKFYFEGFLPHKKGRMTRLIEISKIPVTVVLYESPYRMKKCITELIEHCGGDRKACIVREVSKLFETAITDSLSNLLRLIENNSIPAKGEIVIVLEGSSD